MADVRITGIGDLRTAAAALRSVDRKVRAAVKQHLAQGGRDIWSPELSNSYRASGKGAAMLDAQSMETKATAYGVEFSATTKAETHGLPYQLWEFGDPRKTVERTTAPVYGRKPKRAYKRHTQEQLPGASSGRKYTRMKREATQRAMSLIVQTTIRTIAEALEGK